MQPGGLISVPTKWEASGEASPPCIVPRLGTRAQDGDCFEMVCSSKEYHAMKPKLSYTIAEAASATGLSRWTLHRFVRAGKLDVAKIGSRVLILADSLKAMLERGREEFVS